MKKITLIYLVFSLLVTTFSYAQEVPTPDYSGRPYQLNPDNTLQNLERTDATSEGSLRSDEHGGKLFFTAFGGSSPVRFKEGSLPRIIIKMEPNVDPEEAITLSKAEVKKDRRRFLQASVAVTGKAKNISNVEVSLQFKKIREGVFEIVFPANIDCGEYAFMPTTNQSSATASNVTIANFKVTCFGIDNADGKKCAQRPNDPIAGKIYDDLQKSKAKNSGGN